MLNTLIAQLDTLDPTAGRALGQHFRDLGEQLLARARGAEELAAANERRRRLRAANRQAAAAALSAVAAGLEPAAAITLIATRRQLDPERVAGWFQVEQKKAAGRMRLRNVKIMRLARRGWRDAEIAAKYKLTSKHVNRIVRRMLRENPATPQP